MDGGPKRYPIVDALGRTQEAVFISEGDVYRLITHSRLPEAEKEFIFQLCAKPMLFIGKSRYYPSIYTNTLPQIVKCAESSVALRYLSK